METISIKTYEDIIVKNVNCGKFKNKEDAINLIKYITGNSIIAEKQKPVRYIGGYGVCSYDPDLCYDSMYAIKKLYKTTSPRLRCIYHFLVSFPEYIEDANIVKLISIDICKHFYKNGFQCIYCVHEDTENLHIHIAVNSTSFITGKQMHYSHYELDNTITCLKKISYLVLKKNGY